MNDTVVEASGLSRQFGDVTAVQRLNIQVQQGEVFGLVGPDGAGKTTTIRLLCGLMDPSEGTAQIAGINVADRDVKLKDSIGYMPQRFGLYTDLSVQENLTFFADLFGLSQTKRQHIMGQLLAMTRMEPFTGRPAGKLSGGMKQKLGLMCALLNEPQVLFLDEPTNGVDPVSRRDFWVILYELVKDGITVVLSTAYLDEAERCSRVAFLYDGHLVVCDSPERLSSAISEECFAVSSSNNRLARKILTSNEKILSAEPAGDFLHIFFSPEITPVETLYELLVNNGIEKPSIRKIDPSMEDIFIALVRKRSGSEK